MTSRPSIGRFLRRAATAAAFAAQIASGAGRPPRAPGSIGDWNVLPIFGGGYMQDVVPCPSDPSRLYAYADVGGPYRSDDAGRSWFPLHGAYTVEQRMADADMPRGVIVDPRDADVIVVAAGNSRTNPGGVFVSRDGGGTFRQTLRCRFVANGRSRFLGRVLVRNPFDPDELLCGENRDGVFFSRDGGETWEARGLEGCWLTQICYDTGAAGRVFALSPPKPAGESAARSHDDTFGPYVPGLFRSGDGGRTWQKLSDDSPLEMAILPDSGALLGGFRTAGGESWHEHRISFDGGETWSPWHQGLPVPPHGTVAISAADPRGFRAMSALPGAFLCANGAGDIFRRAPEDPAWTPVPRRSIAFDRPECETHLRKNVGNLRMPALSSIIVDPVNPDRWFATDWNLLYETENAGLDWQVRQNGIMQLVTHCLAFDPFSPDNIFYGVADRGSLCSHDDGARYAAPVHPPASGIPENHPYGCSAAFSPLAPGLLYAVGGKTDTPLYRSEDAGRSWRRPRCEGLPALAVAAGTPAYGVAVSPVDGSVLLCVGGLCAEGRGGVYRSRDRGETWERFSAGLPEGAGLFKSSEWDGCGAAALVFSPGGSAILSAPKAKRKFFLDGDEWRPCAAAGQTVADPFVPGRFLFIGSPVLETTDGGRTVHVLPDFPKDCGSIAFDARFPGLVAINVAGEILVSCDGGRTFAPLPGGTPVPIGKGHCLFLDRGRLFARTPGSGVFFLPLKSY